MNRGSFTKLATLMTVAAGAHLAPGAVAWRRARCRLLPRLSGVGRPEHVALTFDDGPDPVSTPRVLEELDRLGWKATFFCLGDQAERAPDLTKEIIVQGHEVGVHGYRHTSHLRRPAPWAVHDLQRAKDLIEDLTQQPARWFRPPYGAVSASSLLAARATGLELVLWTSWGLDWQETATGATVAAHIRRTWVAGATVLLHDSDVTSAPRSWQSTLDALPELAQWWEAAGLAVGPLGDHWH